MEFNKKKAILLFSALSGAAIVFIAIQNLDVLWKVLSWITGLASPIILGFCIAFVLNVPMSLLEKIMFPASKNKIANKLRRPLCFILALLLILLVIVLIFNLVIPELVGAISILAKGVPAFLEDVAAWLSQYAKDIPALESWIGSLNISWDKAAQTLMDVLKTGATGLWGGTVAVVTGVFSGVVNFFIAFIFSIYMLMGKEKLIRQLGRLFEAFVPDRITNKAVTVAKLSGTIFANFISGQCTEAVILGSLCWLGMSVFGFPYAPMIGALVGFSALVPIVGAFVGTVVGAFMIMMINPMQAIWFVVFLTCLQQIEGNLIYPRVVGTSVGLPAMWVLAAVTIGGGLFGFLGMLFAVPVMSIIYTLLRRGVNNKLVKTKVNN